MNNQPTDNVIADLSASCVRFVKAALEIELDFTQDTLPLVDHYLQIDQNAENEVLGLVVPAVGAYFGEVLRRHLGGTWDGPGDGVEAPDYENWTLKVLPDLSVRPVVAVFETAKQISDGSNSLILAPSRKKLAADVLEEMGHVREDDFHKLAIRFEVIEHLATKLRAAQGDPLLKN